MEAATDDRVSLLVGVVVGVGNAVVDVVVVVMDLVAASTVRDRWAVLLAFCRRIFPIIFCGRWRDEEEEERPTSFGRKGQYRSLGGRGSTDHHLL